MKNLKFTTGNNNAPWRTKKRWLLVLPVLVALFIFWFQPRNIVKHEEITPQLWPIRAIDTMKQSRDQARERANDPAFDAEIDREMVVIKSLGANYVALGTPYDAEFKPYLQRWVRAARKNNLKVWFRGNFSNWEGWFGYEKYLLPADHTKKIQQFITENADLFENGDIFDPCPECENAGYWPQPALDAAYGEFIRTQHTAVAQSFDLIHKKVAANIMSIIGGRAREVLTRETTHQLDNVVTIDHYIEDFSGYDDYISYFADKLEAKTLFGEFGAPVPDIHGPMSERDQAEFIHSSMDRMYRKKENVLGVNYNVLSDGTTALLNSDGTPRQAAAVVKKFFMPGIIIGKVTNSVGDPLADVEVKIAGGADVTRTNQNGLYALTIPESEVTINFNANNFIAKQIEVKSTSGAETITDVTLDPLSSDFLYRFRQSLPVWLRFN